MSWRVSIRHTSRYDYEQPVNASYNEARMTPMTTDRQVTHDGRVEIEPHVRTLRYIDYWGTIVDAFDLHNPHQSLLITGSSLVETSPSPSRTNGLPWSALGADDVLEEMAEYLDTSTFTATDDVIAAAADDLRSLPTPRAAVDSACGWVRDRLTYEPGSTHVSTSACEALQTGAGVCQDFAHVALSLLRTAGVPARYVSGYLHPSADAGLGDPVQGQSHAWIETWDGEWVGDDVTNGIPCGERHIIVARARDYADVTPLKGTVQGGAPARLTVGVTLTRVG